MSNNLRIDLIAIILEEVYGYTENHARRMAERGSAHIDHDSYEAADRVVSRFEARCFRVEG